MSDATAYADRIERLADEATVARETVDPDPPDDERAMALLREGLGPTVALYCEARTGESISRFTTAEFDRLQGAVDDWLAAYAACYGVTVDADYSVRAAAELLVETRNIRDVAQLLTDVPER
ncbi:hypothetical protein [Halomicrobium sp. LC1Hm]|uniref:hypothetical protein n=1 Tax=Halomicrobium sp. LC1Hm TaxID=2610902 RepID=UPI0012A85F75|nr:hypothetical protein [Halomicrobium sp. LC1Hm]QGA82999.1 Uncharacterized protein LC1Hm_1960 [Halomicrobium sp. LC1Hm]